MSEVSRLHEPSINVVTRAGGCWAVSSARINLPLEIYLEWEKAQRERVGGFESKALRTSLPFYRLDSGSVKSLALPTSREASYDSGPKHPPRKFDSFSIQYICRGLGSRISRINKMKIFIVSANSHKPKSKH